MSKTRVILGVDGGGSKSAGAAVTMEGKVLALLRGEGINYYGVGMEKARRRLRDLADALLAACGGECAGISVGMPALDGPADEETARRFSGSLFRPEQLLLDSDAYMALQGMAQGEPGMIVICGTGSMAVLDGGDGQGKAAGGWGYLLGDPGSGYDIARSGLRAAIRAWEGTGPATPLTEKAAEYFGLREPRALIQAVYAPDSGPAYLAAFAKDVFLCAQAGDPAAFSAIDSSLHDMALEAAALLRSAPQVEKVGLYGGIFQHQPLAGQLFRAHLAQALPGRRLLFPPIALPPEIGAVIHWLNKRRMLNEQLLQTLRESYASCRDRKEGNAP